ncbi:CBO0543 family protein [Neobacillus niacini]|uniref:CBO0543 family protein n=1 Tax=Neobacillus niacini TaxID=86668 RepID=UPI0028653C57|nr:CBO0543 family protein [Neobacillus niacini]MDR6997803.1 nitrate reductase NapE component [Neobacillus niacini]
MNFERLMLIGFSFICILAIFKLVPREKVRDAWILFLFLQVITWPAGLFAVEMGWIEYPTQFFSFANKYNRTSFAFEFFIFPIVAIFFSLYYPNKVKIKGAILYYLSFAGFFTICEEVLEKYTTLVEYHGWKWYWTLSTVIISLFLNHSYYLWFKKRLVKVESR